MGINKTGVLTSVEFLQIYTHMYFWYLNLKSLWINEDTLFSRDTWKTQGNLDSFLKCLAVLRICFDFEVYPNKKAISNPQHASYIWQMHRSREDSRIFVGHVVLPAALRPFTSSALGKGPYSSLTGNETSPQNFLCHCRKWIKSQSKEKQWDRELCP